MTDTQLEIIESNPIGEGLNTFRALFNSVYNNSKVSYNRDALEHLGHEDLQNIVRAFLRAAQNLPATDLLPATTRRGTLRSDLLRLELSLDSDKFDFDRIKPLLDAALADHIDDPFFWDQVYNAVTESTPPPQPIASSLEQTPWLRNTSSFANSSEYRKYVDGVLKEELGPMYVGLRNFHEAFFWRRCRSRDCV